jgi:hypothetical protein
MRAGVTVSRTRGWETEFEGGPPLWKREVFQRAFGDLFLMA